ncbi:MAG: DUF2130 domain-containing protein [Clostridia bacterium]|nr:DUF2130 domain-containing protein [Clostridia bacterium]
MHEIKCPNCGQVFQVDETGYAQILKQVRDKEFKEDVGRREKELKDQKERELELARLEGEKLLGEEAAKGRAALVEKEREIERLRAVISAGETEKSLAVEEALRKKEREQREALDKKQAELTASERELDRLRALLSAGETEKTLAVNEAVMEKEQELYKKGAELTELRGKLESSEAEARLREQSIKEGFELQLKQKDAEIEYYKDFKARQSTKMVGESLEQHCLNQFNSIRMAAFPNAYFEKDNDSRTGSKGDFIFREQDGEGGELISIMFEMKNEMDATATKHRNEDFYKELDRDRREKGCEYAVLVSLLEIDNDYFNGGIVDVSYRYEKMYVIRPQFFIPIISLLRNAALNYVKYKRELAAVRDRQLDVRRFEENISEFKTNFGRNYRLANERFENAMKEIDSAIKRMQDLKEALRLTMDHLRHANDKAESLTIKKLTKNAPSVRKLFEEAEEEADE